MLQNKSLLFYSETINYVQLCTENRKNDQSFDLKDEKALPELLAFTTPVPMAITIFPEITVPARHELMNTSFIFLSNAFFLFSFLFFFFFFNSLETFNTIGLNLKKRAMQWLWDQTLFSNVFSRNLKKFSTIFKEDLLIR